MTTREPIIEIRDLHKYYGQGENRNHVLKGIDLTIREGEFISIVGTSGSGKTTLLNIIGGLDREFDGDVRLRRQSVRALKDRALSRLRNETIGFIFQAFNLLPHLTCVENITIPLFFNKRGMKNPRQKAIELLEAVGLADKADSRPTELSGGQKQRVSIARALFNQPRLILCDEPTGSLDRRTSQQIVEYFHTLNAEQALTFVIVTHDEHLSQVCNRIIRLEDGEVLSDLKHDPVPYATRVSAPMMRAVSLGTLEPVSLSENSLDPVSRAPEEQPLSEAADEMLKDMLLESIEEENQHAIGWLPDAEEAAIDLEAAFLDTEPDARLHLCTDKGVLRWRYEGTNGESDETQARWLLGERDEHALDLNRQFTCVLTRSGSTPARVHLTVRQPTLQEDEEDLLNRTTAWQQLGLSATIADGDHEQLEELPEKPERYPVTDEASLRQLLGVLRMAMRRQGQERWY